MGKLFGGSSSTSESGNKNLAAVNAATQPAIARGNSAGDMLASMLGFGGDPAAASAATARLSESMGSNFIRDQGSEAITNNAASRGLLGSGGVLRKLTQFGQDNGATFMGGLMDRIAKQQDVGTQQLGVMSNAGQYSSQKSESKPGLGGLIGGLASGAAALGTGGASTAAKAGMKGLSGAAGKAGMKGGSGFAPAMNIPFTGVPGLNTSGINIPKFRI